VFQGASLQRAALPQSGPGEVVDVTPIETEPGESMAMNEPPETERPEMEPIPIDTTAELLGRAKPRKPRTRAPRPAPAPTPRKAAARKPAARRTPSKKPTTIQVNDDTET